MLSTIARFMRAGERVTITLSANTDSSTRVLIQPVLGKEPDGLKDEAKQLRAALATPLIITIANEELDQLALRLTAAVDARDQAVDQLDAYVASVKGKLPRGAIGKDTPGKHAPAAAAPPLAQEPETPQPAPAAPGINLFENV